MPVKLVILDLDLTLWNHPNVTGLERPFRRVGENEFEDQHGVRVSCYSGVRALLDGLRARDLIIACASWNEPDVVFEIFDLLDLGAYFDYRKVEPHPRKEKTIAALLRELAAAGTPLAPHEVLYVDDRRLHIDAVREAVGPIRFLQYGVDIRRLEDVLAYLDRPADGPTVPALVESAAEVY